MSTAPSCAASNSQRIKGNGNAVPWGRVFFFALRFLAAVVSPAAGPLLAADAPVFALAMGDAPQAMTDRADPAYTFIPLLRAEAGWVPAPAMALNVQTTSLIANRNRLARGNSRWTTDGIRWALAEIGLGFDWHRPNFPPIVGASGLWLRENRHTIGTSFRPGNGWGIETRLGLEAPVGGGMRLGAVGLIRWEQFPDRGDLAVGICFRATYNPPFF